MREGGSGSGGREGRLRKGTSEEGMDGANERGKGGGGSNGARERRKGGAREIGGGKLQGKYPEEDTGQYTLYSRECTKQHTTRPLPLRLWYNGYCNAS